MTRFRTLTLAISITSGIAATFAAPAHAQFPNSPLLSMPLKPVDPSLCALNPQCLGTLQRRGIVLDGELGEFQTGIQMETSVLTVMPGPPPQQDKSSSQTSALRRQEPQQGENERLYFCFRYGYAYCFGR
jgi:hypothetical protein